MTVPRLAVVTPLPPVRSGITDYALDLLPHLGQRAEVDVVGPPTGAARERPPIPGVTRVLTPEAFVARDAGSYDAIFYQIGNSFEHHGFLLPLMARLPGIAVIHDCGLQHLALGASLRIGDLARARAHLAPIYGNRRARALARGILVGAEDPNRLFFLAPYVLSSRGVLVHSTFARERVSEVAPEIRVRAVPMGVAESRGASQEISRRGLGLPDDALIVGSVNTLAHTKRLELVLEAVSAARSRGADVHLLVLGGGRPGARAAALLKDPAVSASVTRAGWTDADRYRQLMGAIDVVVDLRYPSGGETSASLMRALALGKPAILSRQGSFLDVPSSCSFKVPLEENEVDVAAEALVLLANDPVRLMHMSEAAASWARQALGPDAMAQAYVDFAREVGSIRRKVEVHEGLRPGPAGPLRRAFVSATYGAGRFRFTLSRYGVAPTLRRAAEILSGSSGGRS